MVAMEKIIIITVWTWKATMAVLPSLLWQSDLRKESLRQVTNVLLEDMVVTSTGKKKGIMW